MYYVLVLVQEMTKNKVISLINGSKVMCHVEATRDLSWSETDAGFWWCVMKEVFCNEFSSR